MSPQVILVREHAVQNLPPFHDRLRAADKVDYVS
jgi:hypothetical protein